MSALSPDACVIGDPARLAPRAAAAERAAAARWAVAIEDVFLSQPGRLDDRTRAATLRMAEATIAAIEQQLAGEAARRLVAAGRRDAASVLESNRPLAWPRLIDAGLMRDAELIGELIAQARIDLLDETLAGLRAPDAGATLVARAVEQGDAAQRATAIAYLAADGARRSSAAGPRASLPAPLHARLVWWVAAALRERLGREAGIDADMALCAAAQAFLAHDGGPRPAEVAARLVAALRAGGMAADALMVQALDGARVTLFVAALAAVVGIDADAARALVLDSGSDRLWLALRAAGFDRAAIARAGFLLAEADRERDLELLIETLDAVVALEPAVAGEAIATLRLPGDFRAAVRALARRGSAGAAP